MYMDRIEPSAIAIQNIRNGVVQEEYRRAKHLLIIFLSLLLSSVFGMIASIGYLMWDINDTGFVEYFGLLLSGDYSIYPYWKEFLYSIAETFPVFGAIMFLLAIGLLVWSSMRSIPVVRKLVLQIK
jgi:hypothetical protein